MFGTKNHLLVLSICCVKYLIFKMYSAYTTEGGRFARAKRLREAKESRLKAQQENLSNMLTRAVSNSVVSPVLANNNVSQTNTPVTDSNQVKVGRKTLQVPSHLQQVKQMLQDAQTQEKRLKTDISAVEKQQQVATESLTQAKLEQLQKIAASRGLTTEQLLRLIQANQEEGEEEYEDSAAGAFQALISQQNDLLEELRQSHKQNTMHLDLMTKMLLPPLPVTVTEQMSNEEQQVTNSLQNRQNKYVNLLKKIQDEHLREQQHRDMARLIQSLSNNPEVSRFLPSNTQPATTQAIKENQSSGKTSNGKRKRGETNGKKTTSRSTTVEEEQSRDSDLDETVRRLLYG